MSKIEVDTIAPQSGTQVTLGESGDTITIPAGATFDASSGTLTLADGSVTNAKLAGSITNDKLANSGITINGSSVSLGGSTTIETGTSWQSTIVTGATHTAVAGEGYWIDTASNACTITLPASASVGDTIEFSDYARNWGTNAVTLNTNSLNFQGGTTNIIYNTNGQSVRIVYSGATQGWIPTVDDDVPNSQAYSAEYLVVAGGASGSSGAGAGGAGGMLSNYGTSTIDFTIGSVYTAVVGAGGAAPQGTPGTGTAGNDGGNSTLSGTGITTITSFGGGGGSNSGSVLGRDGGSAGGGSGGIPASNGGSGTVGQGNDGGNGTTTANYGAGGGGGAGAAGGNGSGSAGGAGGIGLQNAITGTNTYYAGGGTGNVGGSGAGGAGSSGGGGSGGRDFTAAGNGTDGLGGGGGGGGYNAGTSSGGSGVVILRVATANYSSTTTGSPTVSTDGTDTIIKFTGNGTYTA